MNKLIGINTIGDIPAEYLGIPVGLFVEYHNLNRAYDPFSKAQLLIGMCMDNRKQPRIPDNFAFIIRSGNRKHLKKNLVVKSVRTPYLYNRMFN